MPDLIPAQVEQVVTSEAPQSRLSGAEVAQPYELLAQGMEKLGQGAEAAAKPLAEREGYDAVTRGPDGSLQIKKLPIVGEAGLDYMRAAKTAALGEYDGEFKRYDMELRQKYPYNPQGYQTEADAYKNKVVEQIKAAGSPELAVAVGRTIDNTTTNTVRSLLSQQQEKIRQDFNKGTDAALRSAGQDVVDLIRTGGQDQQQVIDKAREWHTINQSRVDNPVFGEPQAIADLRAKEFDQNIHAAAAEYKINRILKGPTEYQPNIDAASQKYGLNPVLFARQLNQESGFDPNRVNLKSGATGIAQFMPGTARDYGVNPRDAASSIEGAAHYMSDLTRQFGGNTGLALAAYNWGPKNLANWIAAGSNPASMPAETRNYVQDITGQPLEAWMAGHQPDMTKLVTPMAASSSVQRAFAATEAMRNDQTLPPDQRLLNYQAGIKAIQDFRENNIRLANMSEQQQKLVDNNFENAVIADSASEKPTITLYDVKTMPGISAASRMRMEAWLKRDGMPEPMARVSQRNSMDLFNRINLPDGDPNKLTSPAPIRDAYGRGDISRTDEDWLEKRFADGTGAPGERLGKVRGEFSKAVDALIDASNPLIGKVDAEGKMHAYEFERFVDSKVNEYRQGGKNPLDLFDPTKPDYLGKPEIVNKAKIGMAEALKNITDKFAPPVAATPQRQPNESPADYLRRINGAK